MSQNLNKLAQATGFRFFHESAQRIFAPASGPIWHWPHETEVHVNNMPSNMREDLIYAHFSIYGKIRQIRIPLTSAGNKKQYAYILYETREEAWSAVDGCNGRELKFLKGQYILQVSISLDNRRLFVGRIPTHMTQEEVFAHLSPMTPGLVKVIMYKDLSDPRKNRGFCFLEYGSHREAAEAKYRLNRLLTYQGFSNKVNWATPEPFIHPAIMDRIKTIFMRGLKNTTSQGEVLRVVYQTLGISEANIVEIRRNAGYAFVTFTKRNIALLAVNLLQGIAVDGAHIEVHIARPNFLNLKFLPANHPNVFFVPQDAYLAKEYTFKVQKNELKSYELFPKTPQGPLEHMVA